MKKVIMGFAILLILVSIIHAVYLRFNNPDLTQIRYLIVYWKELLLEFIVICIGFILFIKELSK